MAFTHLHVHTEYSLLDGASRINELLDRTVELGMDSIAITDHGNMFGVIEFYKAAQARDIKPILGCEVYTAARTMDDKDPEKDKNQGHLVLLAENMTGYQNLIKIVSAGYTRGFYYKPRIDLDILREHSEGIIALSACLAGDLQQALLDNNYEAAKKIALEYLGIFGEGNYFLELQNQGLKEEEDIYEDMIRLHKETGIPLVATNDVHYTKKEHADSHDILLCIQTNKKVNDEDRMRFPNKEFYLKSEEEMRELFINAEEAIDNTQKIADRCELDIEFNKYKIPKFESPDGLTNQEYLRQLCDQGLKMRYGDKAEDNRERLEYELNTIESMGYVEYFLIVWDFIRYAKENDIPVGPGRGSAAGSIVAYSLQITDIDPIEYSLIFERFLNPERISMPDIDIDFCYEKRNKVIDYVIDKYGADKVAQIITFGTMKAKMAIRDVGRAMDIPYSEVDKVAKMVPNELNITLKSALKKSPDLSKLKNEDARIDKLLRVAMDLEDISRHAGTHAAGVVISRDRIDDHVPLYNGDKGDSTQFTMNTIEELGLLKMDFLGLRTLTVIDDAIKLIKENHGVDIDFSSMKYDDSRVYELISSGNTDGVFQLESSGMTSFMKNLSPNCFEDIIAGISLYRPGPMDSIPKYIEYKKNPGNITYLHEKLEPILSVTYGCLVYQEQVMQIVRDLAGYDYGRSDLVRRAMSKKKADVMEEEREHFINGMEATEEQKGVPGCVANGIDAKIASEIFDDMTSFASYAFNKSHAAAYAVVAYQTAYLKTYFPAEFMAALMTSVISDGSHAKMAKYTANCKSMGIEVLPPCIKESEVKFSVKDGKIRYGMLAVKNVGESVLETIIHARNNEKIETLQDLIKSVDIDKVNKKAIESLIKAGAMDCLNTNRAQLMSVYENLIDREKSLAKESIEGQISLFQSHADEMTKADSDLQYPEVDDFPKKIKLNWEKEMTGMYLTDHPLSDSAEMIEKISDITTDIILNSESEEEIYDARPVLMVGLVSKITNFITKKNEQMAFVEFEDMLGSIETIIFPNTYKRCQESLIEDNVVVLRGNLDVKGDEDPKIIVEKITPISVAEEHFRKKNMEKKNPEVH